MGADDHGGPLELPFVRSVHMAKSRQVLAPAAGIRSAHRVEPAAQAGLRGGERGRGRVAEAEGQREVHGPGDTRRLDDVAAVRALVAPGEPAVDQQVRVAVIDAGEAVGHLREASARHQRGRDIVLARHQRAALRGARVAVAGILQRGMIQHVQGIPRRPVECHVDEQRVALGVGGVGLGDGEVAAGIAAGLAEQQGVIVGLLNGVPHVPRLDPRPVPVAHGEFQGAHVGHVDARVVDLGEDATLEREPHLRL